MYASVLRVCEVRDYIMGSLDMRVPCVGSMGRYLTKNGTSEEPDRSLGCFEDTSARCQRRLFHKAS
jgi:hypothetical protein